MQVEIASKCANELGCSIPSRLKFAMLMPFWNTWGYEVYCSRFARSNVQLMSVLFLVSIIV
jgi:hypothetical protein